MKRDEVIKIIKPMTRYRVAKLILDNDGLSFHDISRLMFITAGQIRALIRAMREKGITVLFEDGKYRIALDEYAN